MNPHYITNLRNIFHCTSAWINWINETHSIGGEGEIEREREHWIEFPMVERRKRRRCVRRSNRNCFVFCEIRHENTFSYSVRRCNASRNAETQLELAWTEVCTKWNWIPITRYSIQSCVHIIVSGPTHTQSCVLCGCTQCIPRLGHHPEWFRSSGVGFPHHQRPFFEEFARLCKMWSDPLLIIKSRVCSSAMQWIKNCDITIGAQTGSVCVLNVL